MCDPHKDSGIIFDPIMLHWSDTAGIDSHSQVKGCHCWELQDQIFAFCITQFGTTGIFWVGASTGMWTTFCCDQAGIKIYTKKTEVLCLPETQGSVLSM